MPPRKKPAAPPPSAAEYEDFAAALRVLWAEAHAVPCGMLSQEVLPLQPQPPPAAAWSALVCDDGHAVAASVARAGEAPLMAGLNGWLADLQKDARLDGFAVAAALGARFVWAHLAELGVLRAEMARLTASPDNQHCERKCWAASDNLRLAEEALPNPAQRGVMNLYQAPPCPARLCASLYDDMRTAERVTDPLDRVVNCVKDLADLAARYQLPSAPKETPAAKRAAKKAISEPPPKAKPAAEPEPEPALPEAAQPEMPKQEPPEPAHQKRKPEVELDPGPEAMDSEDGTPEERGEVIEDPPPPAAVKPDGFRRQLEAALRETLAMNNQRVF